MSKPTAKERLKRFDHANSWAAFVNFVKIFLFFIRYLKNYKLKAGLMLISGTLSGPIWLLNGLIFKILLDDAVLATDLPIAERMHIFYLCLGAIVVWYLLYIMVKEVIPGLVGWYLHIRVALDLTRNMYLHEMKMELEFHHKRAIGEHMYRTAEDAFSGDMTDIMQDGTVISLITEDWMQFLAVISQFIVAVLLFWKVDPIVGIFVGCYLVVKIPAVHMATTWGNRIELEWREVNQERFAVERDIIAGLKTHKSLGTIGRAFRRYVLMLRENQEMFFKLVTIKFWFLNNFLLKFILGTLMWERVIKIYVLVGIMRGTMTFGDMVLVQILASQLQAPISKFIDMVQKFRKSMVPASRMYETMSLHPNIKDKAFAPRFGSLSGRIAFDNVSFGYSGGPIILNNVDFDIKPGERIAFVGPSGAGKSTIFKLLLRLYEPATGRILVDGKSLADHRIKSYLNQIGVVMQQTHIFSGSILENIRFGDMYASEKEVRWAVEQAELSEMVEESPAGLETFLGEGTKLSGGQKQRIGIARALIRKPKMFIMDEPTAHVDVIVETQLLHTIEKVTRGTTTLIISHRITPILFVDKLVVLTPGGVEAVGTHDELLKISPTYQVLWEQQRRESGK